MGNPFPARVLAVDRDKGSLTFAGQWGGGPSYKIIRGCQYYLEDKPQYLDSPGEFWFDKTRATAAGFTSACPATRTRTEPVSRWPGASI